MLRRPRSPKNRACDRLGFGPGQRYASKGCYILPIGKGSNPQFIKTSGWVVP